MPSCWASPAPRRCTPTWATSAVAPSGWPGPAWCCRPLALNYLGQCAAAAATPKAISNPFFLLVPVVGAGAAGAVVLATLAAIIASQAVISGAYSMTRQAMQLGFLPRMQVLFTSATRPGQIYIPAVNWALLGRACVAAVGFGSSSALAAPTASP